MGLKVLISENDIEVEIRTGLSPATTILTSIWKTTVKMEVTKNDLSKQLVSIHYPGVVKNEAKAFETLGGLRTISSIYCGKNRRLELRMRPDDVFCKPAFATKRSVSAVILKLKVNKKKKEIKSCKVLGHVTEEYRFTSLCDFQYIPTSETESLYDKVVPRDFNLEWFRGECPFFLQPTTFSRTETVQNFNFSKVIAEENKPNVIGTLKRKRCGYTKCVSFDNPKLPEAPKLTPSGGQVCVNIAIKEALDRMTELFEKRPIYSKAAIACISGMPSDQLKYILPCVSYNFMNGPWRALWVRFGYDPRKDPSSRIYQTLDYRVKSRVAKEVKQNSFRKRREALSSLQSMKYSNQSSRGATVIARNMAEANEKEEKIEVMEHIFRPGMLPPSRQYLYQYCDLHVPEIQAMLEQLPVVDEQATCNEVHGWLPAGMSEACREIINRYIEEEVRQRQNLPQSSSMNSCVVNEECQHSGSESNSSGVGE